MYEEWDEMMPDDGDFGISIGEALCDVLAFFAEIVGALLLVALVLGIVAYSVWKEFLVINFLTS